MGLCEVNSKNSGCAEHRLDFHVMGTGRAGISVLRLKQCTARGRGCFHFFSNQICLLKGRIKLENTSDATGIQIVWCWQRELGSLH